MVRAVLYHKHRIVAATIRDKPGVVDKWVLGRDRVRRGRSVQSDTTFCKVQGNELQVDSLELTVQKMWLWE